MVTSPVSAQKKYKIEPVHYTKVIKGNPEDIVEWGEGKLYLLDLWGTWCAPCIRNIPALSDLQDLYRGELVGSRV